MGFKKKTWKNRIAEYINRRLLTMEDGSTNLVTVARDEGTISQEGDAFNAANMNDLEDRIEAGFEEVSQSLTNWITLRDNLNLDLSGSGWQEIKVPGLSDYNEIDVIINNIAWLQSLTFKAYTKAKGNFINDSVSINWSDKYSTVIGTCGFNKDEEYIRLACNHSTGASNIFVSKIVGKRL